MGLLVLPAFTLLFRLRGGESWTTAAVMGLVTAVICAPVLGHLVSGQVSRSMEGSGPLSADDRVLVDRAARRGAVPEDDALRAAALRVVEERLDADRRTGGRAVLSAAVLVLVAGLLALTGSPWWWAAVGLGVALLVLRFAGRAHLQRRAERLGGQERHSDR